jgi:hypothetical protein
MDMFLYNMLLNRESSVNTLTSQKPQMFTQPVTTPQKILHLNYKDETFNFKQNNCSFVVCILENTVRRKMQILLVLKLMVHIIGTGL